MILKGYDHTPSLYSFLCDLIDMFKAMFLKECFVLHVLGSLYFQSWAFNLTFQIVFHTTINDPCSLNSYWF